MAVESTPGAQAGTPPPAGPAPGRARRDAPLSLLTRFLTLREGSIIVVTIIAIVYFGVSVSRFFTGSNFKSLLPYFCFLAIMAAGQVFVMTLGEIDLSIGAAVSVHAVRVRQARGRRDPARSRASSSRWWWR